MTLQRIWNGTAVGDQFGIAVAPVGDVDGDYRADVLVGANVNDDGALSGGRVSLYRGGASYPAAAFGTFAGTEVRSYVGGAVAGGADLDGDGYADFAAGAPGLGADDQQPGRVFVFLGGPGFDLVPDLVIAGTAPAGQFGQAVALVPDLDGDGYGDLVIGAPRDGDGRVFIHRGGPGGPTAGADAVIGARPGDSRFGKSLAWLPDRDGDGRDELLVGVPRSSQATLWAGAVLLFAGTADLDTVPDLVLLGEGAGDEFGTSLSAAGDFDGDGRSDILVGAPFANVSFLTDAGRAYLFGSSGDLDETADLVLAGTQLQERFGYAVALGFDWNGDGRGDLAVGAPDRQVGVFAWAGAADIHFGTSLPDTQPDAVVAGDASDLHLGTSLAPGGDVQGSHGSTLCVGGYNAVNAGVVQLYGRDETPVADVPAASAGPALAAPWPNPANPATHVALSLPRAGAWRVAVHDLRGRQVALLHDGPLGAGRAVWLWRGTDAGGRSAASGTYLVRARSGATVLVRPLSLVR